MKYNYMHLVHIRDRVAWDICSNIDYVEAEEDWWLPICKVIKMNGRQQGAVTTNTFFWFTKNCTQSLFPVLFAYVNSHPYSLCEKVMWKPNLVTIHWIQMLKEKLWWFNMNLNLVMITGRKKHSALKSRDNRKTWQPGQQ